MYQQTTRQITVNVRPIYLEDQSEPEENHFVWAYHVRIVNHSSKTVRLLHRNWSVTDSAGREHHIQGEGVVGEQPFLHPGESFEYTSGTPLETPSGFMTGQYEMEEVMNGDKFYVEVPAFSLDSPYDLQKQLH